MKNRWHNSYGGRARISGGSAAKTILLYTGIFICDMRENSEILVDGDIFYKNGQFQV